MSSPAERRPAGGAPANGGPGGWRAGGSPAAGRSTARRRPGDLGARLTSRPADWGEPPAGARGLSGRQVPTSPSDWQAAGGSSGLLAAGWPNGRRVGGWYAYRARPGADLPAWPVEVALAVECPAEPTSPDAAGSDAGGRAQAVLLLRSPSRVPSALRALAAAAREVEAAAGVDAPEEFPLAVAPALPGLEPMSPAAALAHLAAASARGLAPPARRRQPAAGDAGRWRSSAGSVLTCDGPGGRSAQAVIVLRGVGEGRAIALPPGGALVLRAWRGRRGWGLACGLVLGSAEAMGLGREAGRRAADARAAGWLAAVATGQAALALARGGDPRQPPPLATASLASGDEVAALVAVLLSPEVIGSGHPGPPSPWALAP
jgi:hypothetical protein